LTAADSRTPSSLPAAMAVAAFITWPHLSHTRPLTELLGDGRVQVRVV
jgi:hypothetical protein